mmetsp:Transcript_24732/g.57658  ORF Transcript_24732/g.57658 Transcript_24732/m.57658 type:complete len:372 (-) Transcript_24732:51-1166(-)
MMRGTTALWLFVSSICSCSLLVKAFAPVQHHSSKSTTTKLNVALSDGDQVMLIGPGLLQLVLAKTCKAAGLRPLVCAPQTKLDNFKNLINDDDIVKDFTIGMPEIGEPQMGNIAAVIFCAEDAVLPDSYISRVLDYTDKGQSAFVEGGLKKVVVCAPISEKANKDKPMGWIPIFQNEDKQKKEWKKFIDTYRQHRTYKADSGTLVRFGTLYGGSVDGPEVLQEVGLDEGVYKMSFEQFRDLKERAFDRYRLGAQVLKGDGMNAKSPLQEKREKEVLKKGDEREAFRILNGYPEQDRSNRHTVAQAIVQSLVRDDGTVPKEMSILSKAIGAFPTRSQWDEMFANPGPAPYPDPADFDPASYGIGETTDSEKK